MVRVMMAALAVISLGDSVHAHGDCGAGSPLIHQKVPLKDMQRHVKAVFGGDGERRLHNRRLGMKRDDSNDSTRVHRLLNTVSAVVPVICHGGRSSDGTCSSDGSVHECFTREDCVVEVNHLNTEYNAHGIEFVMAELHDGFLPWADDGFWGLWDYENDHTAYKEHMIAHLNDNGISNQHYLNLFYTDMMQYDLFGFATFPPFLGGSFEDFQGVVNDFRSCATCGPNDSKGTVCTGGCEGDTNVHETGHYLGLLHTFDQYGEPYVACSIEGDSISDTPSTLAAHGGCPAGFDPQSGDDGGVPQLLRGLRWL